jgi:nucleotide-binding universal stress UspA family protein
MSVSGTRAVPPPSAPAAPGTGRREGKCEPCNSGLPADLLAVRQGVSHAALLAGIALAARWGSRLSACRLPAEPAVHAREPTVLALLEGAHDAPETPADAKAFARLALAGGVMHADWLPCRGRLADTLQQLGAWHDLAILDRDSLSLDDPFEHFGQALLGSRMPCLLLPADCDSRGLFPRVAIGWNGSIEATRAIHAALPFLRAAEHVTLIDGARARPDDDADEPPPAFDPLAYLARHGITAQRRVIRTPPSHAGEALLAATVHDRSDLLVMGGYSHSPVRERVLGGATRHVLQHAPLAVLVRH